jgi:hypothetical protein
VWTRRQVLIDGVLSLRVSKEAKWVAPRYAMVRKAVADGAIVVAKIPTANNRADIFTKPLVGLAFAKHRDAILGRL